MKHRALIFWGVVAAALLVSALAWDRLPEAVDSHWNARGEADATMPKFWGLMLAPLLLAVMAGLGLLIPKIDPLGENIALFRKYFDGFFLWLLLFFLVIHLFLVLWNLGIKIPPNVVFPPALAVLCYAIGVLCGVAKRNWFVGIRTPWTLSSESVWEKTHHKAGPLFKLAAVLMLAGSFLGEFAIFLVLAVIIGLVFYLVVYSYLEFRHEQHTHA